MKYMGSKARIAKYILPIILKDRKPNQCYVEPFVGGANIIDKVDGLRIASDSNEYNICLFKAIQNGFIPPDFVSEKDYKEAQKNRQLTPLVSFIGYGCSYSGKWFGGYARGNDSKGNPRNYCLESKKNILKQSKQLQNILFFSCSYEELEIPDDSIIYCDPPYKNTTKYKDGFNHKDFWEWCRVMSKKGHKVFISEYNGPDDFECIWEMQVNSSLTKDTGSKKATEKLFIYKG